jgi:hypothetical protein
MATKKTWIEANINLMHHDKKLTHEPKKGDITLLYCTGISEVVGIVRHTGVNREHSPIDANTYNEEYEKYNKYEFVIDYKKIFPKGVHYRVFLKLFGYEGNINYHTSYSRILSTSLYNTLKDYIDKDMALSM